MNISTIFQYVNGFSLDDAKLEELFSSVPASAYCKDKQGNYLKVNDIFINTNRSMTTSDVLGKTDAEMRWHNEAQQMMLNDQEIMHIRQSKTYIESARAFDNTLHHFLSHKSPLTSRSGKIIGLFGISFLLPDAETVLLCLQKSGLIFNTYSLALIEDKQQNLSPRQMQCLHYLVKGMTIKQIAAELELSPKTIEHYIAAIKTKLHCKNRSELVAKALQLPDIRSLL